MRIFSHNKLCRDKIIDVMEQNHGAKIHWHSLNEAEFAKEIRNKLLEEAHEVILASTKEEIIEELADLYEVIDVIKNLYKITHDEILIKKVHKYNDKGGFDGRKFVTTAEHPAGSVGEKYCLSNPTKYPEIEGFYEIRQ